MAAWPTATPQRPPTAARLAPVTVATAVPRASVPGLWGGADAGNGVPGAWASATAAAGLVARRPGGARRCRRGAAGTGRDPIGLTPEERARLAAEMDDGLAPYRNVVAFVGLLFLGKALPDAIFTVLKHWAGIRGYEVLDFGILGFDAVIALAGVGMIYGAFTWLGASEPLEDVAGMGSDSIAADERILTKSRSPGPTASSRDGSATEKVDASQQPVIE